MSFTYNSVANQVANLFGNIKGADPATAQTNYAGTMSTSTIKGPDFVPGAIQDAILNTICEIVETIAYNRFHPEWLRYAEEISGIGNGGGLPLVAPISGQRVLGVHGGVIDVTGNPLKPAPLDKVVGFDRFVATVYAGKTEFLYCWDGRVLFHTRSTVRISVCAFDRPSFVAGNNVPLADYLEEGLVMGSVARLAGKENMYTDLWTGADRLYQACLANIRSYADPSLQTTALGAPSIT